MILYGISVSYYTGKLEAYLRYKEMPYQMMSPYSKAREILPHTGAIQVPMLHLDDDRWMSDTTPIIQYFDREQPGPSVFPEDPIVKFIALLIEDYGDEWLWRSAMHYRWTYEHDRVLLSRILVDELMGFVKAPRFLKLRRIASRQRTSFVIKDGVTDETQLHVEQGYFNALTNMTAMLQDRPFLLGETPSIADYGMMGPMLRHFGQDPTPAEIMRNEAPIVYEWVARLWNTVQGEHADFLAVVPEEASEMLKELTETHLVQLKHNADAFHRGQKHFEMKVQGCHYKKLPVSRYRVWCLEQLRHHFSELDATSQLAVKALLPYADAEILWQPELAANANYDLEGLAPFNKAINVYGKGTPE
ncbi:MAG: glutathione S-transferase [Pseudomonadales bacterium]|nr:glutathione S-transferase [Pseudomonadales bacterium]MBO6594867.1 glutathione S-transferase [Pseudomonadales bacterium]MBO6821573.1 glutathione S-transferase [Pseudomonadales bacterium]